MNTPASTPTTPETQASRVVSKFGTLADCARALGHKNSSTVQGWLVRGFIPPKRHQEVYDAARRLGIPLAPGDFSALTDVVP